MLYFRMLIRRQAIELFYICLPFLCQYIRLLCYMCLYDVIGSDTVNCDNCNVIIYVIKYEYNVNIYVIIDNISNFNLTTRLNIIFLFFWTGT